MLGNVMQAAFETARGSQAILSCLESPHESIRVACLLVIAPILRHMLLNPVSTVVPSAKATARSSGPRIIELLGGALRALIQHQSHTLLSVHAAMGLVVLRPQQSLLITCPEALAVLFAVVRSCGEQERMEALLQLSSMLKSEPSSVVAWLQQPGWQLWLLDLVELEDEVAVLVDAASARELRGVAPYSTSTGQSNSVYGGCQRTDTLTSHDPLYRSFAPFSPKFNLHINLHM
jgi:hypothetical protein